MNWDDILERMRTGGLPAVEEIYMENYGKVLSAERAEFKNRSFRCAWGVVKCSGLRVEVLLFPSENHLDEFMEVIGSDPWFVPYTNVVFHFPKCDPAVIEKILDAVARKK